MVAGTPESLVIDNNTNISLEDVNVTITMGSQYADGNGNFIIYNKINSTQTVTLGFDPGGYVSSARVWVDNYLTSSDYGHIKLNGSYDSLSVFNVTIKQYSHMNITLEWKATVIQDDYKNSTGFNYKRNWISKYKVIGKLAWKNDINRVVVTFISNCPEFNDAQSNKLSLKKQTNNNGKVTWIFNETDFKLYQLLLAISGKTETGFTFEFYFCASFVILIAIVIIISIYRIIKWKKNKSFWF
jgi:hypothetical protein